MSIPTLTPSATESAIVLPESVSFNDNHTPSQSVVAEACPIGFYIHKSPGNSK